MNHITLDTNVGGNNLIVFKPTEVATLHRILGVCNKLYRKLRLVKGDLREELTVNSVRCLITEVDISNMVDDSTLVWVINLILEDYKVSSVYCINMPERTLNAFMVTDLSKLKFCDDTLSVLTRGDCVVNAWWFIYTGSEWVFSREIK